MVPGLSQANAIEQKLRNIKVQDIQLLFDEQIKMWAVVQVRKKSNLILLPAKYSDTDLEPYILWWCKNDQGGFRPPDDRDFISIVKVRYRAQKIWDQGEKRADHFDELDAEKDRKHQEKFHDKIHTIAPAMKKALKSGNL
jgi:hypothetical protein